MADANATEIGSRLPLELRLILEDWQVGGGPLYRRLASALGAGVERGALLPGSRLPPERELARQLGIGRSIVAGAYELLRRRGLVERRQGRGTEVTELRGAGGSSRRATELTTLLQRNLVFRSLSAPVAGTIDLLGGGSGPNASVRDAIAEALAAIDTAALIRGQGYAPLGYPPLRRAVAAHLTGRGAPTAEDELIITNGAQQAIALVAAYVVAPNDLVVVEDPSFPGAIDAFRTAGARMLTVPLRDDGVDVEILTATLARNAVRAVYLAPTFHNPTGAVIPEDARRDIARIGEAMRIPIIEDEALADLALDRSPPRSIAALAPAATVISIGSLSKLVWGGLRVGWIRAPRATIGQLAPLKAVADLGGSLLSQAVASELLVRISAISSIRTAELRDRRAHFARLMSELLPAWRWREPTGGLCVWARLPAGSSVELSRVASDHGVAIVPGSAMSPIGGFEDYVRISFDESASVLDEGLRRLAAAWRAYASAGEERAARDVRMII